MDAVELPVLTLTVPGPVEETVVYEDDFEDPDGGRLREDASEQYRFAYEGGEYVIGTLDPEYGRAPRSRLPESERRDVVMRAEARLVGGRGRWALHQLHMSLAQ